MAAGRRLRLKLKYGTRFPNSDMTQAEINMTEPVTALGWSADHTMQSPRPDAPQSLPSSLLNNTASFPPHHQTAPITQIPASAARRRRPSKTSTHSAIKRSVSTPNVRRLGSGDAGMSLADKRRNKLGYHRTSVACGHCRRRKIRCLLAPDDPQGRCSNCIRLKKECNFFPVDQQPPVDRRPRTASKAEGRSGETSASSSSSPGLVGGHVIEQVDHYPYPLPLNSHHDYQGPAAPLDVNVLASGGGPANSRVYGSPHHDRPQWGNPWIDHAPISAGPHSSEDPSHSYWKVAESPMTPASFSPHFTAPPNTLPQHPRDPNAVFASFGPPRQDPTWPPQTRSMSLVEDNSHYYQNHYHQPTPIDYRRRASDLHPPSLQNSANSSNTSMSEAAPPPPLSAPITSQPGNHYGLPAAWNSVPGHPSRSKAPEYGGWYSAEPGQLANVQEEEAGSHFNEEVPVLYPGAGHR